MQLGFEVWGSGLSLGGFGGAEGFSLVLIPFWGSEG